MYFVCTVVKFYQNLDITVASQLRLDCLLIFSHFSTELFYNLYIRFLKNYLSNFIFFYYKCSIRTYLFYCIHFVAAILTIRFTIQIEVIRGNNINTRIWWTIYNLPERRSIQFIFYNNFNYTGSTKRSNFI